MYKFKQYLFVGASLLLISSGILNAENNRELPYLLAKLKVGSTLPTTTEPQSKQLTDAVAGFWLSSVVQDKLFSNQTDVKKQILAFSSKNSALIKVGPSSRLVSYKVKGYRATSLSFVAKRLLIRKAQLLEQQNNPAVKDFYKKRRVYPLQKLIDRFIIITKDAQAAGYTQAEEVALIIEAPSSSVDKFKVKKEETLRLLLIGGDLYLADGITYIPFYQQAVLWNELAKEKPAIWAKFNIPLESSWREISSICMQRQRSNLPAEECWVFRNRAAELGAVLPPVPVKVASRHVAKRGAVELHLKKYMSSSIFGSGSHRQLLDYCLDSSNGRSSKLFYRQLKARGYRNTLWSLTLSTESIEEKPSNWSEQEYRDMRKNLYLRNKIFLREDGMLGLTQGPESRMIFDVRNKWVLDEKLLSISLDNDQVMLNFTLNKGGGMNFSSNIQPAPNTSSLALIPGNYLLYSSEIPYDHPQKTLLTKAQNSRSCNSNNYVAGVVRESLAPLPEVIWPSRKKGSFPRHWHIRRVSIYYENSGKTPTPLEIEQGGFFYLRESGDIGRNTEHPADYDFSINGRWRIDGSTMHWKLGETEINFESTEGFTQGILSELLTNPRKQYLIFPTDLLAGAMAVPEPKTVPTPAPVVVPVPTSVESVTDIQTSLKQKKTSQKISPTPNKPFPATKDIQPTNLKAAVLIGCWKWSNGAYVVIGDDGSALIKNMPQGNWGVNPNDNSKFIITWPPIVDTLTLSQDGASFSGKNQYGVPITGKRVADNTQSLIGSWTRESGLLQKVENNGTISAAQFTGTWEDLSSGGFEFLWPVVDNISFDGENRLSAENQFGSVIATRDQSCSLR